MQFLDDQGKKYKTPAKSKSYRQRQRTSRIYMLVHLKSICHQKTYTMLIISFGKLKNPSASLKTELDTRPVYLQKENRIKGHFFICYTAVLLSRILQFKILENKYSASTIYDFMRKFRVENNQLHKIHKSINQQRIRNKYIKKLNQPITNYYLTDKQIKMMHTR